jgi:RNA polymerase I-specific transcription-initiation factor
LTETHRAKFLFESSFDSKRVFHALRRGNFDVRSISEYAAWHRDLTRTMGIFVPDISENIRDTVNRVKNHNLSVDKDRNQQSLQREIAACDQLAFDLVLSTHVYSGRTFPEPKGSLEDAFETMSLAANPLSGEQPPPVQFSLLTPILRNAVDHYPRIDKESEGPPQKDLTPVGVRLLLSEWIPGTDPSDYTYEDPYQDKTLTAFSERGRNYARSSIIPVVTSSQTQRPPLVVTASAVVTPQVIMTKEDRRPEGQTQDVMAEFSQREVRRAELEYSQDLMINTQPVPGRFGGRQGTSMKKPGKKRIGGF